MNSNLSEYIAIKSMNKTLNAKILTLKQEINDQRMDFNTQQMQMVHNHRRETDVLKKNYKKTLEKVCSKAHEQGEEIKRLKDQIELLENSEKELREKVQRAKHDEKHKNDYEKISREMSASKKEIKILKEQITVLEKEVAEKEEQKMTETEKHVNLSDKFGTLAKQHEADMTAMKNDLISKMDEKEKNTREMVQDMEKHTREMVQGMFQSLEQLIKMQNGQEIKKFDQRENTLPPIVRSPRLPHNSRNTIQPWRV
jgi:chromosome segregation ATPase